MRSNIQEMIAGCSGLSTINGTVLLQGRAVHGDTEISLTTTPCTSTDGTGAQTTVTTAEGNFGIVPTTNYQCLNAYHTCYLTAQKSLPQGYVGRTTLLGGDLNGDNCVDIYDLTAMGAKYGMRYASDGSPTPCTDVNADGIVDIYDLVISASNFGKCGPVSNWE
jgi:hypothetical protein